MFAERDELGRTGTPTAGTMRKRRSLGLSSSLSRATTVSSRMRDAYIDQENFRQRYMNMLARHSEMQNLVDDLKRQLVQQNYGTFIVNDVPVQPSNQSSHDTLAVSEARELQSKLKSPEVQCDAREMQRLRELAAKSELTTTKAKRELTALNEDLRYLASMARSAYTDAYREHLMKSGAVVNVDDLQGADHAFEKSDGNHFVWGVKKTQADRRTVLSLCMKLWYLNASVFSVVTHLYLKCRERDDSGRKRHGVCLREIKRQCLGISRMY